MKLKPPDSSLADYEKRRHAMFMAVGNYNLTSRERLVIIKKWIEANSPYSATEQLENLRHALKDTPDD